MVKNLTKVICLLILFSCSPQKELFNQLCVNGSNIEYENLLELLYSDISSFEEVRKDLANLDVSLGISGDSHRRYLFALTEFALDYEKDPEELFLLTEYLRVKYNSTNELYDEMLRASIRVNKKNYCGIYLLAKLRFENGLYESAFPLVNYIYNINGNIDIKEEYSFFINEMGFKEMNQINLDKFISQKVYYIDKVSVPF